jgi:hypothetical protein
VNRETAERCTMLQGLVGSTVHGLNVNDVQFAPPGSGCSVQFGTHITSVRPGSAQGLYLVVSHRGRRRPTVARHLRTFLKRSVVATHYDSPVSRKCPATRGLAQLAASHVR